MDKYKQYKNARDIAWKVLLDFEISTLPVSLNKVFKGLEIKVHTYQAGMQLIKDLNMTKNLEYDGFSVYWNGQWYVFYDHTILPKERTRFTLAHELGHILLGHRLRTQETTFGRVRYTVKNDGEMNAADMLEFEANIFASRLLAPAIVLHDLEITEAEAIAALCGLSYTAARHRVDRMKILNERNKYGYSPYERQVHALFKNFIKSYNKL